VALAACRVRSRTCCRLEAAICLAEFCHAVELAPLAPPPPPITNGPIKAPKPPPAAHVFALDPARTDSVRFVLMISLMSRSLEIPACRLSVAVRDSRRAVTARRSQSTTAISFFWHGASGRE
jgi:hypothetical protein